MTAENTIGLCRDGSAAARHAFEAMMQMTRIDIAAIGDARRG